MSQTIVASISIGFSLLYGCWLVRRPPSAARTIVKTIPVSALALISYLSDGPYFLTAALALGAMGDMFLSRDGEQNFLLGLGSFLFGHLCFCILFHQLGAGLLLLTEELWRIGAAAGLTLFAVFMVFRLLPHLGKLKIPVIMYVAIILLMGLAALSLPAIWPLTIAILGAGLFIASDTILAFELFILDERDPARRYTSPFLWFLYWGGQSLIVWAMLQ